MSDGVKGHRATTLEGEQYVHRHLESEINEKSAALLWLMSELFKMVMMSLLSYISYLVRVRQLRVNARELLAVTLILGALECAYI